MEWFWCVFSVAFVIKLFRKDNIPEEKEDAHNLFKAYAVVAAVVSVIQLF